MTGSGLMQSESCDVSVYGARAAGGAAGAPQNTPPDCDWVAGQRYFQDLPVRKKRARLSIAPVKAANWHVLLQRLGVP